MQYKSTTLCGMAQKNDGENLMNDNIFVIGGQVKGPSFIGRKKLVQKYRSDFIGSDKRRVYSIVGLSRSGKTSFVKEVFEEHIPDGVFYFYQDISVCTGFFSIWYSLCNELSDFLSLNIEPAQEQKKIYDKTLELVESISETEDQPDFENDLKWEKFQNNITKIFRFLKKLHIRSILVFDEFDRAASLFTLGTAQFSLFRTIFADGDIDVSAITISRRKMETIEGKVYQSSTLANVMDFKSFKGFDEDDIQEYFSIFAKKYGHELSISDKSKIRYYAGSLPYLLSIFGYYIVDSLLEQQKTDLEKIFSEKCPTVKKYYESCVEQLERDNYLEKIIPFVIGPCYGVTRLDLQVLESVGYISLDSEQKYICISEYFSTILSTRMLNLDIWDEIINLEKRLKALLRFEAQNICQKYRICGDTVNDIELEILKIGKIGKKEIETLQRFSENDTKTYFSVMSMKRTVLTIAGLWEKIFRKYFCNRNFDEFEPKLSRCYEARNPIAHGHEEEVLTDADRNIINSYCTEMFDLMGKNFPQSTRIPDELELLKKFRKTKV